VNLYFRFGRSLVKLFTRMVVGYSVTGAGNIPKEGAAIIASNHISNFDPPFVGSGSKREVFFFAKSELFGKWFSPIFISNFNTIPVKRGRFDRESYMRGLDILHSGELLLLFPEGTRSRDGTLREGKTGAAKLSLETGVSVVPACISNSNRIKETIFSREKVSVAFGAPITPDSYAAEADEKNRLRVFTEDIMSAIRRLQEGIEVGGRASR
jgi:1-acyl-sn-glycerol-3-phosphate acyltransferase